jgi:hypothetical protein
MTFYISLAYGILYLTFEAYPISFQFDRGWSPTGASLPFIAILLGIVLASGLAAGAKMVAKKNKKLTPEDRIPPMILGSFLLPIGLFWLAWTSHPSTPWPAQVISGAFIGCGLILIFSKLLY